MSLAGGYPGRSAPSVKRCAAERTLNVTRLARLDLSGTTGTKLVNYVVSDRVIRSDPSPQPLMALRATFCTTMIKLTCGVSTVLRSCRICTWRRWHTFHSLYRCVCRRLFTQFPVVPPLIFCNDAQPVLKPATGSNGEQLTRRSLGIDKNAYARASRLPRRAANDSGLLLQIRVLLL